MQDDHVSPAHDGKGPIFRGTGYSPRWFVDEVSSGLTYGIGIDDHRLVVCRQDEYGYWRLANHYPLCVAAELSRLLESGELNELANITACSSGTLGSVEVARDDGGLTGLTSHIWEPVPTKKNYWPSDRRVDELNDLVGGLDRRTWVAHFIAKHDQIRDLESEVKRLRRVLGAVSGGYGGVPTGSLRAGDPEVETTSTSDFVGTPG